MKYTLASLEDNFSDIMPSENDIKNYLETLPKDKVINILKKLPTNVTKEFCGTSNALQGTFDKQDLPLIAGVGLLGGGVGYYVGGIGGSIIGLIAGAGFGYYIRKEEIL